MGELKRKTLHTIIKGLKKENKLLTQYVNYLESCIPEGATDKEGILVMDFYHWNLRHTNRLPGGLVKQEETESAVEAK